MSPIPIRTLAGASFRYDRRQDSHYELQEVRAYALMLSGLVQHLDIGFEGRAEGVGGARRQWTSARINSASEPCCTCVLCTAALQ